MACGPGFACYALCAAKCVAMCTHVLAHVRVCEQDSLHLRARTRVCACVCVLGARGGGRRGKEGVHLLSSAPLH